MWWSKRRNNSARSGGALIVAGLLLVAAPALAQQGDPNAGIVRQPVPEAQPRTSAECTAYATQKANEEYLAQDNAVRRNSPFQSGPPGTRDPYVDSQRQQLDIDRATRERQFYDACVERLKQRQ